MNPAVKRPAYRRVLRWLTVAAIVAGTVFTFSYGSGAHLAVRYLNPRFGRWWNEHEFELMILAASALGILSAIGLGLRLLEDGAARRRVALISLVVGAVILEPLAHLSSALGRFGWSGARSFDTYEINSILDKVLIAGVYFLKIAGFGLIAGIAIFAVVAMAAANTPAARREAQK